MDDAGWFVLVDDDDDDDGDGDDDDDDDDDDNDDDEHEHHQTFHGLSLEKHPSSNASPQICKCLRLLKRWVQ